MMIKKEVLFGAVFLLLIILMNFGNAEIYIHRNSSSVEKTYSEGDHVKGRVNLSLINELNKNFTSNFKGGVSLFDALNTSEVNFACDPRSCRNDYEASLGESEKEFNAVNGKLLGFAVSGGVISSIEDFKFFLSDAGAGGSSCNSQLEIDLFNDGSMDFYNTEISSEVCDSAGKSYGCFNSSGIASESNIVKTLYCEKINVSSAPGYRIGAKIKKNSANTADTLVFSLYDLTKNTIKPCTSENAPLGNVGEAYEAYCDVEYPLKSPSQVFVCVKDNNYNGEEAGYKIRTEASQPCGGTGEPKSSYPLTADFEIFAQPLKYAPVQELSFNLDSYEDFNNKDLKNDVKAYLGSFYGLDCTEGCIIPVSVKGSLSNAEMHSARIAFKTVNGIVSDSSSIFDLNEQPFLISMNSTFIDLEKMKFEVPNINGSHNFYLCFGEENCDSDNDLLTERINANIGFSFDLLPRSVLIGQRTVFVAQTSKNVTSSQWKFGDGSAAINANGNKAEHSYMSEGEFTIEVTLSARGETSTKKFKINVGDPKRSANLTISRYKDRIGNVKQDIGVLPSWIKTGIEERFNELDAEIRDLNNDFIELGQNATDQEYTAIMTRALELEVPLSVKVSERGLLPLAAGYNGIDPEILIKISGEEGAGSEFLKDSILLWMNDNYESEVEFETYSEEYDDRKEDLVRKYKVNLNKISEDDTQSYFVIGYPSQSIKFKEGYDVDSVGDDEASYIRIDSEGSPGIIEFAIISDSPPEVEELGMFISPATYDLKNEGSGKPISLEYFRSEGKILWGRLITAMVILLIVMLAVYLLLQHWYKYSYEKHLFKNPDDLYNLLNFIYNSRKAGLEDRDIKEKLQEKSWKGEQLSYAFKKIDGKRTGMFEIPVFKFLENKKVRKEIEKRQEKPLDARFIKI